VDERVRCHLISSAASHLRGAVDQRATSAYRSCRARAFVHYGTAAGCSSIAAPRLTPTRPHAAAQQHRSGMATGTAANVACQHHTVKPAEVSPGVQFPWPPPGRYNTPLPLQPRSRRTRQHTLLLIHSATPPAGAWPPCAKGRQCNSGSRRPPYWAHRRAPAPQLHRWPSQAWGTGSGSLHRGQGSNCCARRACLCQLYCLPHTCRARLCWPIAQPSLPVIAL
jgi:hypothetical protein